MPSSFPASPRAPLRPASLVLALALAAPALPAQGLPPVAGEAAAGAAASLAAPLPADSAVVEGRLPNGLRYLIRANGRPEKRAELRLVVDAGSVLEDPDQRGLAHFVEHMAFNGTRRFPKNAIVTYLERIGMRFGAHVNAYTGFDETVYMLQVPTDTAQMMEKALEILDDWASGGVTFDPAEVEKERGVVVEEWRLGQGADQRVRDQQFPVLFRGSRYADRLPIGDERTLRRFDRAALVRFYREWYRPELETIVAVGDFDPRAMERAIRRHFGDNRAARPRARARAAFTVPDHDSTLVVVATDKELPVSSVMVAYKQPVRVARTVGDYRGELVEELYDRMLNARLEELTRRPDAPFLGASSSQGRFVRTKEVYALGASVKDGGIARGLEALLTEAARVDRHGFTATELARAKQDLLRGYEQGYAEREKTPSSAYAGEYVRHALEAEPLPGIAAEYAMVQRFLPTIALAEVNRLARDWITERSRVIVAAAPDKPGVSVPRAEELRAVFRRVDASAVAAYEDRTVDAPLVAATPAPGRVVEERELPSIGARVWTLSNGVRVILKPTTYQADELLLRATSPGGTSLASDSAVVSAQWASYVVGQLAGFGAFDAVALEKKLAGKAVRLAPAIDATHEGLTGRASPRDLETLLQLVHLVFTAPRRDTVAFAAFVENARHAVANRALDPQTAFSDTLQAVLAQHHPRVRPVTSATFDAIRLDSAYAFFRDRFADAGDFTFVLVGNFHPDSIRPLVAAWLAMLPASGRRERWRDLGIRPPTGVVERTVRRGVDPKAQTALVFTGPADTTRATRYAMSALTELLTMRLRDQLREALGGTYGVDVSGGVSRVPVPSYQLAIDFGSAPDRVAALVDAVYAQIDSLQRAGPTAEEVAKVREIQARSYETNQRQNGWWAAQLTARAQSGDRLEDIVTYDALLRSLTPALVRDAATRFLDRRNVVRVTLMPER